MAKDDFVAGTERSELESSASSAVNLPLVGDEEGSRGYRILAFVSMLVLAAAAIRFFALPAG